MKSGVCLGLHVGWRKICTLKVWVTTSENKNWVEQRDSVWKNWEAGRLIVAKTLKIGLLPPLVLRSRAALVASNSWSVYFCHLYHRWASHWVGSDVNSKWPGQLALSWVQSGTLVQAWASAEAVASWRQLYCVTCCSSPSQPLELTSVGAGDTGPSRHILSYRQLQPEKL